MELPSWQGNHFLPGEQRRSLNFWVQYAARGIVEFLLTRFPLPQHTLAMLLWISDSTSTQPVMRWPTSGRWAICYGRKALLRVAEESIATSVSPHKPQS